eukprot:5857291-Amphidinium_carterae.1
MRCGLAAHSTLRLRRRSRSRVTSRGASEPAYAPVRAPLGPDMYSWLCELLQQMRSTAYGYLYCAHGTLLPTVHTRSIADSQLMCVCELSRVSLQ